MTSHGSRSASGRQSSLSVDGQTLHTASPFQQTKKSYKYRRVGSTGSVDETLFTSHRDQYLKSLNSSSNARPTSAARSHEWKIHSASETLHDNPGPESLDTPPIKASLMSVSSAPRTRSRLYKSSPTYVDESLFGPKLQAPSFAAPWEKSEDKRKGPTLTWSPPVVGSLSCTPRSRPPSRAASAIGSRAGSAMGTKPRPVSGKGQRSTTPSKPVWK